eukprot:m.359918 g.359918  ORF g.359918 m.359918 type:complete len:69 (+) comp20766_c1_seq3:1305-1511(+)
MDRYKNALNIASVRGVCATQPFHVTLTPTFWKGELQIGKFPRRALVNVDKGFPQKVRTLKYSKAIRVA